MFEQEDLYAGEETARKLPACIIKVVNCSAPSNVSGVVISNAGPHDNFLDFPCM